MVMLNNTESKWCEYCGKQFSSTRESAKYCSNACRTKSYRQRHNIPSPDFSKIVSSKMPTENERRIMVLADELSILRQEELHLEERYKVFLSRYEQAMILYESSHTNWSSDNFSRRRKEFDEFKVRLFDKQQERIRVERDIETLQIHIDRDKLDQRGLIVKADEIRKIKFDTIKLAPRWNRLFGELSKNFHLTILGQPKSGKSSFAMQFADSLKDLGRVVYFDVDDLVGLTTQQKIIEYNIRGIDLSSAKNKKEFEYVIKKGKYNFVFIDSCTQAYLSIKELNLLKRKYPGISFTTIYSVTDIDNNEETSILKLGCDVYVEIKEGQAFARGKFLQAKKSEPFSIF
jgi:hypothetical protein